MHIVYLNIDRRYGRAVPVLMFIHRHRLSQPNTSQHRKYLAYFLYPLFSISFAAFDVIIYNT